MIAASEYGRAMWQIATEDGAEDEILSSLRGILTVFEENPEYVKLLDTPALSNEEKHALIESAFGACEQNVKNFLMLLCDKHGIRQFSECYRAYQTLYREAKCITEAICTTATPLSDTQRNALCKQLSKITGKEIMLTEKIDTALIGGIVLHVDGKQLDGSVKTRLETLRTSLADTIL